MAGSIRVAFWNLQNLFDTDDDPISRDFEFTTAAGWTPAVFAAKKTNIALALSALFDGQGPELLAVCEIEKDSILEDLFAEMGNTHLKVVKDISGTSDLRGIDVTVAYDNRKLKVVSKVSHIVSLRYATRDIFEVVFEVKDTGEELTVIASHWPSRRLGRFRTEGLRIALAENIAFLVRDCVRLNPVEYEAARTAGDIQQVRDRWENNVLLLGDFNDEPGDRSVVDHLQAGHDLDRVIGETNDIDGFDAETGDYRGSDTFLFNAMWPFAPMPKVGTYFIEGLRTGERFANRFQVLDQIVASRGLLSGTGLTLDLDSVDIFRDTIVATSGGRPRPFSRKTRKGTSDHLPVTAILRY